MKQYVRYIQKNIRNALKDTAIVFIMGPRQSGKTTLVQSLLNENWQYITLDDQTQLNIAKSDPLGFIKHLSARHIAIDEIQRLPELLLAIKQTVDANRVPGRFLLTGSSNVLVLPHVADSLAGRIECIALDPLSECEIKQTKPSFLKKLTRNTAPHTTEICGRNVLTERLTRGCFPEPLQRGDAQRSNRWYKQYIHSLVQKDMHDLTHIDHPDKMLRLLRLTAHYSGKLMNLTALSNKIDLNRETTKKYLQLIEHLFLLRQVPAWHNNHHKRLIKTPKLHLTDTGLICAIRDINCDYLQQNPHEIGALLETFVINELHKQASWLDQDLRFYHYRNKDKVEVDCILENAKGDYFAIEIKASATLTPKDFAGLQHFKQRTGKHFRFGVLLYDGEHTAPLADNLFAVPIATLWH